MQRQPKEPQTLWGVARFFIMAGILASIVGIVSLLGLSMVFGNLLCGAQEVDQEVLSPDGKYKLLVYGYECGSEGGFTSDVALLPVWKPNIRIPGTLMVQEGRPEWSGVQVRWLDDQTIEVRYDPAHEVSKARLTQWFFLRKFTVQYIPLGE